MSNWKIVKPRGSTNLVLNPSWGIDDHYTEETNTTVELSTTYSVFGTNSLYVSADANDEGVQIDCSTLTGSTGYWYASMFMAGAMTSDWDWSLDGTNYFEPTLIATIDRM